MQKKIVLYLGLFLLSFSLISANIYIDYYFCDENGNSINNVKMIGWRCDPANTDNCITVNRNFIATKDTQPLNSGDDNHLRVEFASAQNEGDWYIYYFYRDNYQANFRKRALPSWSGPPTYYEGPYDCSGDAILEKKDNCKAEFTPTIQSCAEAGLPLSILTDTNLDAETASAFGPYDYYWPSELDEWDKVNTRMDVDVTPQGSSNSVSGYPKTDEAVIYGGTTHDFTFLWQTSKDTNPGTYTVTMESSVPDAKCDQGNDVPVTKTFDVYIAPTLDGCKAELNSFEVNPPNPDINQEITFTGTHLNTFQNWSYTSPTVINIPAL